MSWSGCSLGLSGGRAGGDQEQPGAVRSSQRAPGDVRKPGRSVAEIAEERKRTEQRTEQRKGEMLYELFTTKSRPIVAGSFPGSYSPGPVLLRVVPGHPLR